MIESFPLVTSVELFDVCQDVYTGDQVAEGKKSLAFRVLYQSPSRTLGEHEVNMVQVQLLEKLGRETGHRGGVKRVRGIHPHPSPSLIKGEGIEGEMLA